MLIEATSFATQPVCNATPLGPILDCGNDGLNELSTICPSYMLHLQERGGVHLPPRNVHRVGGQRGDLHCEGSIYPTFIIVTYICICTIGKA